MEYFTVSLLNGVIYGLLLFMVSAGLTLIFGMMGVLNFAHASFYMIGAYAAYTLTPVTGFWAALVLATVISGALGMAVERYFLRRVHKFGHAQELLVTFGLAFIVAELVKLFYGDFPVDYRVPQFLNFAAFRVFDADYPFYRLLMGGVSLVMFGVIYLLLSRTRVGIVVRSAIYRPRMAEALGHNVPLVFMSVFGVGAAMAGLAGAVAGVTPPTPTWRWNWACWCSWWWSGGLGSLGGAMIASLLIGLISSFSVGIDASLATLFGLFGAGEWAESVGGLMTVKISSLAATLPFLLMLVVLLVKPSGLKGEQA